MKSLSRWSGRRSARENICEWRKRDVRMDGFGIVEAIASALVLSVTIGFSLYAVSRLERISYVTSLREAVAQVVDEDIETIRNDLWLVDYTPANGVSQACYKTSSTCYQAYSASTRANRCSQIALYAAGSLLGQKTVSLSDTSHKVFGGSSVSVTRTGSAIRPSFITSGNSASTSVVRLIYAVDGDKEIGIASNTKSGVIRIVDINPDSHAYCEVD